MAWPEEQPCAKRSTNRKARRRSCLKSKISSNLASKCVARAPSPARRNQRFERGRTKVHEKYLGDSYDLVKRFWCESLGPVAPLYAHPRFVPSPIRSQYTAVTKIPILDARPEGAFGLLLDPHTGVPVADGLSSSASVGHAPLSFIVELNQKLRPEYLICFDQSYHRKHSLSKKGQMEAKTDFPARKGNACVLLCFSCFFSFHCTEEAGPSHHIRDVQCAFA